MAGTFQVVDLLNSLVRLEHSGNAFYGKMAERSKDRAQRDFFRFLADQEEKHEQLYTGLAQEYAKRPGLTGDLDDNYVDYLQTLVNQSFDFDESIVEDLRASVQFALSLEKDTIIFIGEIETLLAQPDPIFRQIKNEERGHIRMIQKFREDEGIL